MYFVIESALQSIIYRWKRMIKLDAVKNKKKPETEVLSARVTKSDAEFIRRHDINISELVRLHIKKWRKSVDNG